jgi:hypothetical protein
VGAPRGDQLRERHDQRKRRSLPRLEPAHDEAAEGAEHERPGPPLAPPALHAEQHERHECDRERGHQVAPQVLPRPHLAGDEVEGVLARVAAPVRPGHQRGSGHDREQHQHQSDPLSAPRRQQAAGVEQGPGEGERDRHRLPEQVAERHREAGHRVQRPGDQEARVQKGAVVRREVVTVADQAVLGRLADPGEVLELVGRKDTVGTRERATLREQRGEHGERQSGERRQHEQLEAIEAEGEPVSPGRLRRALGGPGGAANHRRDRNASCRPGGCQVGGTPMARAFTTAVKEVLRQGVWSLNRHMRAKVPSVPHFNAGRER